MLPRPTVVVIDDSPIMRKVLKVILGKIFDVVAEGQCADDALSLYETHRPTVMTLDIVMPGRDGLAAAADVLARFPAATLVMCSSLTTPDKIVACRQLGVSHYMLKPFVAEKVMSVMRFVLAQREARHGQASAQAVAS